MNISTRHLKAFLALAAQKNFTRAAEISFLSQPAFSMLIQSLEESVGVRLFDRGTRRVELTVEGRVFESAAERLLAEFENVFSEINDYADLRKGRVTIAALPSLSAQRLPPVIAEFHKKNPGVEVILRDVTSDDCLDLVRRGRTDFALTAIAESADLDIEPVLADSFYVVCSKKHPLAKAKLVQPADLLDCVFVQQDRSSSVRQQIDAVMYPLRLKTVMEVTNMATAAGLVACEIGIAIVPAVALFQFQRPNLVRIPVAQTALSRQICIVRPKNKQDSIAAASFIRLLRQRWGARAAITAPS
ncbi:MAG TPA: LysR substrate-binding domain-containing protein [Burkholderiaceae bacterium]|jgi:DNA-binding transcriptional LysR family regulator|nr:LysR substrate-binding domain-containing protein [Burkholderiaceae bacterium]